MAKLTTRNINVRLQVIEPEGGLVPAVVQTIAEGNVVTVAGATPTTAPVGDMVTFFGINSEIDGKPYYILASDAGTITVKGKTDLPIGSFVGAGCYIWGTSSTLDLMPAFCINKISGDPVKAGTEIVAKTFCGTDKMSGAPEAGSISFSGFMEDTGVASDEFEKAALDGKQRIMEVKFPDQSVFYFPLCVSGFTFSIDPDAFVTFDATAVLTDFYTKIDLSKSPSVQSASTPVANQSAQTVTPAVPATPATPAPVAPAPVEPVAVDPVVVDPAPVVDPVVVDPVAVDPTTPVDPVVVDPVVVDPVVVDPAVAVDTTVVDPAPVEPTVVDPVVDTTVAVDPVVDPTVVDPTPVDPTVTDPAVVDPVVEPVVEPVAPVDPTPVDTSTWEIDPTTGTPIDPATGIPL